MQIRGREVDFKIGRLKDAEALEKALDNMGVNEKKINRKGKLSEILMAEIQLFRSFIVEATGEDVLDGCEDFEEAKGLSGYDSGNCKAEERTSGVLSGRY